MTVYLVGAGPGDPGLITVRGAELLAQADVVIFDRLVSPELLELAPPGALRIDVGKRPGQSRSQEDVNDLLVLHGRAGGLVVRLKGGDPFVFGRGGEEAMALRHAAVPFEVVPGVTSAFAVPASAGVPVTHRGISTSVTVVTGQVGETRTGTEVNWEALAAAGGTIVVLMGLENRAAIAARLMAGGRPPGTPVVAVQWGTTPARRTVRTTLAGLAGIDLGAPATIVVGEVAGLDLLAGDGLPLAGLTVAVTRAESQSAALSDALASVGATVVALPVLVVADPEDGGAALAGAAAEMDGFDWVVFTSANAVQRLAHARPGWRPAPGTKVAVVGPATAEALSSAGVVADVVADPATAEALVSLLPDAPRSPDTGGRVLYPRADAARDVVAAGLAAKGWLVDDVIAYRVVAASAHDGATPEALDAAAAADVITFASPSAVASYRQLSGPRPVPPVVACIGPVTAEAATAAGLVVDVVAPEHSAAGLVAALVAARPSLGSAYALSSWSTPTKDE